MLRYICFVKADNTSLPVSCGLKTDITPLPFIRTIIPGLKRFCPSKPTDCCPKERRESLSPAENESNRPGADLLDSVLVITHPNKSKILACVDGPVCACCQIVIIWQRHQLRKYERNSMIGVSVQTVVSSLSPFMLRRRKKQGIFEVIRIHCLETMNV